MIKKTCKICKKEVVLLDLSDEQKYFILGAIKQDLKLFAKNKICSDYKLDESAAEVIIEHINADFGKCSNCEFDKLIEKNIECPNCGKLNYNISDPYVNKEQSSHPEWCLTFCSHLGWSMGFDKLNDESVRYLWCDGIVEFDTRNIISRGEVITKAWIGEDGQGIYEMKIIFGDKSISNFKNGGSLIECIPKTDPNNWVFIEPASNKITVKLD